MTISGFSVRHDIDPDFQFDKNTDFHFNIFADFQFDNYPDFQFNSYNRKTKSICTMKNGSLVRKTHMSNSDKEMAKNDHGVTLTQSCGDVKSTRVFHKA